MVDVGHPAAATYGVIIIIIIIMIIIITYFINS